MRSRLVALAIAIAGCAGPSASQKEQDMTAPRSTLRTSGHAPVNGIRMYFEIHGEDTGTPLVLLHGGGSTIDSTYGRILPLFARHRRVIALEEQNHGRTDSRDIPERFTTSADDVAALLAHLQVGVIDIMGFSNGASVALQVAIRHPALVRKVIFASSMTKKSGTAPQFWEFIARATFEDMPQPLKDAFLAVNPDPHKLRIMFERDAERMRNFVETSDDEVRSVKVPVLIIAGDRDVPTPEHAVELARLFPQARLLIIPGGHGDYLGDPLTAQEGTRDPRRTASHTGLSDPRWVAAVIEEFLASPD